MPPRLGLLTVLACAPAPGCLVPLASDDDVGADAHPELAECRGELDDDAVADAVLVTDEYGESVHEMIACGRLTVELCSAVISGVLEAIQIGSDDATPDGFTFADGVYRSAGSGALMELRFYLAEDTSFGKAGDLVRENLMRADSYLVDAALVVDLQAGTSELRYSRPGPLVELLGFGAAPANPLPVGLDDLDRVRARLGALAFDGIIQVDDVRPHARVTYAVDVPRTTASALVGGGTIDYELREADAMRRDLEQSLVVDHWGLQFLAHGTLRGDVEFHVDGGPLAYAGVLHWNDSGYPERELSCTP